MATLYNLKISNYRRFEKFEHTFTMGLTCFIGQGDSGKSTILDAISAVLTSSFTFNFSDSDFHNCDTSKPIEIEATLIDIPDKLLIKYPMHLRGIINDHIIDDLESNEAENAEPALTIKLTVMSDLEPIWELITDREQEAIRISGRDRAKLNMSVISDYSDRQFNFNKGNPLYGLISLDGEVHEDNEKNIVNDILRESKSKIDNNVSSKFNIVIKKVVETAEILGIELAELKAALDFKDIFIKENSISLHEGNIPLRLKGKGSKRLISLAIQLCNTDETNIIIIDEIELGLEPHRVQNLVRILKKNLGNSQIIISTHSRDVAVEMNYKDIFILQNNANKLFSLPDNFQGTVRVNPEALFAKRIIVCEGTTEIGLCRAFNEYRENKEKLSLSCLGIRLANGSGNNMIKYTLDFHKLGYDVCLFCDSDLLEMENKKVELKKMQIPVIDCEDRKAIEQQIFDDVPWEVVKYLLNYRKDDNNIDDKSLFNSIFSNSLEHNVYNKNWLEVDNPSLRETIGNASKVKYIENDDGIRKEKGGWFKTQTEGEEIGKIIFNKYGELHPDSKLKQNFEKLSSWIDKENYG